MLDHKLTPTKYPRGSKSIGFRRCAVWVIAWAVSTATLAPRLQAQDDPALPSLTRIAAGTKVGDRNAKRWNRIVLLAKPRLASGDVNELSETVRKASTAFTLTILATVKPYSATDGSTRYQLAEVGVGYSVAINGVQTVISSDTVQTQGADPGFIGRQVLSTNEEQLKEAVIVVRSTTLLIFDTPGIVHRQGKHRDFKIRHLVWIDPLTGQGATVVWLLGKDEQDQLRPAKEPLKLVATGTTEDRKIHVDGSEFFLGIPSERAFALEDLPPGQAIGWTAPLAQVAALPAYSAQSLSGLSDALNEAIAASRQSAGAAQ
jgi:hypothetical protein